MSARRETDRLMRDVAMRLLPDRCPVHVRLVYDPADPLAAGLHVRTGRRHDDPSSWVVWELGRDLLAAGLYAPSGDGAVRVVPDGDDHVQITLIGDQGVMARLLAERDLLVGFIDRTCLLMPAGSEDVVDALDAWLAEHAGPRPSGRRRA